MDGSESAHNQRQVGYFQNTHMTAVRILQFIFPPFDEASFFVDSSGKLGTFSYIYMESSGANNIPRHSASTQRY